MPLRVSLFIAATTAAALFLPTCNEAGLGPTPPITSAMRDASAGTGPGDSASASDAQTGAFFTCTLTSDCVAVPKNGCCDEGFKEAVNQASVGAYQASFTCTTKQACPTFRVVDARVPHCTPDTHKCELVRPDGARSLPTLP